MFERANIELLVCTNMASSYEPRAAVVRPMYEPPSPPCQLGTARGHWDMLDWSLHPTVRCSKEALLPFLRIRPDCARKQSRQLLSAAAGTLPFRRCLVANATLLHRLRASSLLMVGDSTAASMFVTACNGLRSSHHLFVPNSSIEKSGLRADNTTARAAYYHHSRKGTMHWCILQSTRDCSGPVLGSFSHYGVVGPRWWSSAYPLAPFLANNTLEQVRQQLPKFCEGDRGSGGAPCNHPSLVVANSGLWDLEAFWLYGTNRTTKDFTLEPKHIQRYVQGVHSLLFELRRTFPRSKIMWRTAHPALPIGYGSAGTHPLAIHALNEAVRAHAPEWDVDIIETAMMLQQLQPRGLLSLGAAHYVVGTWDGRHLVPFVHVPLVNLLLNVLLQTTTRLRQDEDADGGASPRESPLAILEEIDKTHPLGTSTCRSDTRKSEPHRNILKL